MFTGIVTDIGAVVSLDQAGDLNVRIATRYDPDGIALGASIACEGVCLTVVDCGRDAEGVLPAWFDVQVSAETVSKTNLERWVLGRRLNLERALKVGDELGGHIVSGHVDGVATIIDMQTQGDSTRISFQVPEELARFVAQKGSVALNGTSLTVNEVSGSTFGVNVIPHTQKVTTWGDACVGDLVNLEIDTLARYVARLAEWDSGK